MRMNDLVEITNLYCTYFGYKPSTIAQYALKDSKLFKRLDSGGSCTMRTAEKLLKWLSNRWPDNELEWPKHIERPK